MTVHEADDMPPHEENIKHDQQYEADLQWVFYKIKTPEDMPAVPYPSQQIENNLLPQ
jgi:hypothetical protein